MTEKNTLKKMTLSDEVNLQEMFSVIWRGKLTIITITFLFAVIGVFYALSLPNIYKSEVLLAPAEESQGGMSGLASQFGGLASIAGVNLGGKGSDKTGLSLEILKSRAFVTSFVNEHNLKPIIMAAESWDLSKNELLYNKDLYDSNSETWSRKVKPPLNPEPSNLEVHEYFVNNNLLINQDADTGLVTVGVKHLSPYIAKEIVEKLITSLNGKMKKDDIKESAESIKYLRKALNSTPLGEMKKVFYQLIEQQEQTKMLASVREQYVLKTIDPPVVAEIKDSPGRALICVIAVLIGFILSTLLVLARYFFRDIK